MKKMKLSVKLIAGFLSVALIAAIIGVVGIYYTKKIQNADMALYEFNAVPAIAASNLNTTMSNFRLVLREYVGTTDENKRRGLMEKIKEIRGMTNESMKKIEASIDTDEDKKIFTELQEVTAAYRTAVNDVMANVDKGNASAALATLADEKSDGRVAAKRLDEVLTRITDLQVGSAKKTAEDNRSMAKIATTVMVVLTILGAVAAAGLGIFLTLIITRPVNRIVAGMSEGADQVASAASQVSASSQNLAEGASEQASSLEETSSSLEETASMAKQNSDNAGQAKAMMHEVQSVVENANRQMAELIQAISEITRSSEETGKIIKTIDEIAFQTNLLALNAAVEAARAGEAGAGFAVVADEVRNLAMRAAEAAKHTSDLIEKTIKAVQNGSSLTMATQEAFKANAEISGKVAQLVDEIATASEEQAHGINQINTAVTEMDKVTQQTAANAEESASASEELNAQAQQMRGYVAELSAVVGGNAAALSHQAAGAVAVAAVSHQVAATAKRNPSAKALTRAVKKPQPEDLIPLADAEEERAFKNF
ncbi:MAG: methyl-accepting chemotaxis protein [Deltaproteobacteria bacterium]|nr:methyl-accepting chemotaxis protein [Deltaproteobacteria bacterium]